MVTAAIPGGVFTAAIWNTEDQLHNIRKVQEWIFHFLNKKQVYVFITTTKMTHNNVPVVKLKQTLTACNQSRAGVCARFKSETH